MKQFVGLIFLLVLFGTTPRRLQAQIVVIDDVILLTSRQKQQEQARRHRHLDPPGGENLLSPSPGADEPRLGEEPIRTSSLRRILSTSARLRSRLGGSRRLPLPTSPEAPKEEIPLTGPLEWTAEDEGPAEGLTLDAAIERLLACNTELAARFQDIPKARADILTAGLRSNPFVFFSASNIPYGSYSPERPGATSYDLTVIQPIDLNNKRQTRIRAAEKAKDVLEAQYQDAVRQEIARLFAAYTDVLAARAATCALRAGLERLTALVETSHGLAARGQRPQEDVAQVLTRRAKAEIALRQAEMHLIEARRALAVLLVLPPNQADCLRLRGSLHDRAALPPCIEELIHTALETRPDLTAYRLGTERATADLRRERAEALDNAFLFYTPFHANVFAPQGKQNAIGWGLGVLLPVPIFDRNQGDIARARVNVDQTHLERQDLERRIAHEVQVAAADYTVSRRAVQEYEQEVLTAAPALHEEMLRRYAGGQDNLKTLLEVQEEYHDLVREYLETLVRHRRDMLRLNTVVAQRLLP